jgi:hypothetical protein
MKVKVVVSLFIAFFYFNLAGCVMAAEAYAEL